MTSLSGKVAVITGGNQGIGRAIAQAMGSAGASLAICARTRESVERTAAEVSELGVQCLPVECDVSDPASTCKRPLPDRTPYGAAKMGVIGLVRSLAVELGPHNIRVNSVCPGPVAGPRLDRIVKQQAVALGISEDESMRRFSEATALKRALDADEVAAACVFLASDSSSGITGEDMNVSAGLVMY